MWASLEQHILLDSLAYLDWNFMEAGWHAYQAAWGWWMQAGSVPSDQKFSWKWNLWFFKTVLPNLGSLLYIISSLFSHFRSWDYLEHFGIYSQLNRKSKTWFFIFLNVYISWIEWDKILISQLSHPKFRYFANQNGPKGDPIKMKFRQFLYAKMRFLNS